MKSAALVCVLCLCLTGVSSGVLYVDADTTNTTLADGTAMVAGSVGYSTSNTGDGLWQLRAFANGATIFGSNDKGGEDAPRLKTSVTVAEAGTYDVYAYFWGGDTFLWRGRAGLTDDAGDLTGYNTFHFSGSTFAPMTWVSRAILGTGGLNDGPITTYDVGTGNENGGYFDNTVIAVQSDRTLCEVFLGQVTVDTGGQIDVYIDDLANTSPGHRTWYDGVGIAAVPEPATLLLLGSGGLMSIRRRRR